MSRSTDWVRQTVQPHPCMVTLISYIVEEVKVSPGWRGSHHALDGNTDFLCQSIQPPWQIRQPPVPHLLSQSPITVTLRLQFPPREAAFYFIRSFQPRRAPIIPVLSLPASILNLCLFHLSEVRKLGTL